MESVERAIAVIEGATGVPRAEILSRSRRARALTARISVVAALRAAGLSVDTTSRETGLERSVVVRAYRRRGEVPTTLVEAAAAACGPASATCVTAGCGEVVDGRRQGNRKCPRCLGLGKSARDAERKRTVARETVHSVEISREFQRAREAGTIRLRGWFADGWWRGYSDSADDVAQERAVADIERAALRRREDSMGRERLPDDRRSVTKKIRITARGGHFDGYIHVGFYADGRIGECFVEVSKAGDSVRGLLDGACTALSVALQHGAPLESVAGKWVGTQFEPAGQTGEEWLRRATSPLDYVGRYLLEVQRRISEGDCDLLAAAGLDP